MAKRSAQSERRGAALAALLAEYRAEPDDYDRECEEDVRPYLSGRRAPRRFVCVTEHDGKPFFLPHFSDAETAQARAVEYMRDDLFTEIPVAVVDLDTGARWYPEPWAMPWRLEAADSEARVAAACGSSELLHGVDVQDVEDGTAVCESCDAEIAACGCVGLPDGTGRPCSAHHPDAGEPAS